MLNLKLEQTFNKKTATGVRYALQRMRKLLTPKDVWIKGEEFNFNEELQKEQYCLIGALREVDGPFEDTTHKFLISLVAPEELVAELKESQINEYEFEPSYTSIVENFNDASKTTHKKVLSLLDRGITKLDKRLGVSV